MTTRKADANQRTAGRTGGLHERMFGHAGAAPAPPATTGRKLNSEWDQGPIDASRPNCVEDIALKTYTFLEPYRVTSGRERRGLTP